MRQRRSQHGIGRPCAVAPGTVWWSVVKGWNTPGSLVEHGRPRVVRGPEGKQPRLGPVVRIAANERLRRILGNGADVRPWSRRGSAQDVEATEWVIVEIATVAPRNAQVNSSLGQVHRDDRACLLPIL